MTQATKAKKKKIWIPGGKGMLGTDVARECAARGHQTLATDHATVDVTDDAAVAAFFERERPTHVINCAAYTQVDKCESELDLAMKVNADAPASIGAHIGAVGAFAVHVSTDYVFAGDAAAPYVESDARAPVSAYGRSKAAGEDRFLAASRDRGAVVRTSWLFGVHGKCFPATMLRLMAERDELRVVDDQRGRPTYTVDLARALVDLAERESGGVFHFANAGEVTWHGFATAIRERAISRGMKVQAKIVHPISTSEYPTPAKRPAYSVLSTNKIERALGALPRPWQAALDDYLSASAT